MEQLFVTNEMYYVKTDASPERDSDTALEQSLPSFLHDAEHTALLSHFSHSFKHFLWKQSINNNVYPPTCYLLTKIKSNYLREILLEIVGVQINVTVRHFTYTDAHCI